MRRPGPSRLCSMTSTSRASTKTTSRVLPNSCLKNAAIWRADQTSPKPETRSRLRCDAARTSDNAFKMLWISSSSWLNSASTGFAPAAPSSSSRNARAAFAARRARLDGLAPRGFVDEAEQIVRHALHRRDDDPEVVAAYVRGCRRRGEHIAASATLVPPNLWTVQTMTNRAPEKVRSGFQRSRA